jgi:two-component system cell cycle sensor histidine kinase/response regulator CckA
MCFDLDSSPPIPPISGAAVSHDDLVLEASDGVEAFELMATKGRIGLLISDVQMPGMDGPSMVAMIRRHQADLPILLTSGYPPPDRMPAGVRFLAKPFSSEVLLQHVSEMHLAGAPS